MAAAVAEAAKNTPPSRTNGKLRLMCRYGGHIVSLPQTKSLYYTGGDTRIVAVPAAATTSFVSLVNHLSITLGISYCFRIKYQLPDHDLDSLISVATDEDLQIMIEEHSRLSSESSPSQSRIRLFLFPLKPHVNESGASQADPAQPKAAAAETDWFGIGESELTRGELTQPMLQHPKRETWFVDALRSARIMQNEGNNGGGGGGDGSGGLCGQESIVLETNSSFGSSSSSASLTNLPPTKSAGEDSMANLQVKVAPAESAASENSMVNSISHVQTGSSHELPPRPHVLENNVSSNPYEAEASLLNPPGLFQMNKPAPVPGYIPSPFLDQAQQHVQVIYPGPHYVAQNPPGILPVASYYPVYHPFPQHTNHLHFQPPQPYPIYYMPIGQSHQPYGLPIQTGLGGTSIISTSQPPVNPSVSSSTQQVDALEVRSSSPLLPELASQIYAAPQSANPMVQISNEAPNSSREAVNYNNDLEEDAARAQIYKSQPPPPVVPSQYHTVMLTEAFGQLRTDSA